MSYLLHCECLLPGDGGEATLPGKHVLPLEQEPRGAPLRQDGQQLHQVAGPGRATFHVQVHQPLTSPHPLVLFSLLSCHQLGHKQQLTGAQNMNNRLVLAHHLRGTSIRNNLFLALTPHFTCVNLYF